MNITIRKGMGQDIDVIFSLIKDFAIFQKTPERVTITPQQMLPEKDFFQCFVAETVSTEIVGFASFFFAYYSWTGKAFYLDDLYVKETFRGGGDRYKTVKHNNRLC
ncbi:MAG: GNAT family N-acetyltransferase [Chitinophagaceae bacterium]